MKKKSIVLVSSLVAALAICITTFSMKKSFFVAKGQTDTYTFTLNATNAPAIYGENVEIVATGLGNEMKLNYVGASASSGNHMALAANGYVQNVDKIKDLTSLVVTGSGSFKLHTGFEGYTDVKSFTLSGGSEITLLSNVSYFKLEAVSASIVESIAGELNCLETEPAVWKKGSGEGPVYDTSNWNRLIHDVDTSKDFSYTLRFSEVTSETERTSRPTFFVYPASYEADDSITCTNDGNHYFNGGGYYHIRQDNYQVCHAQGVKAETTICTASAWINDTIIGSKNSEEGYFGGTTTKQARITRDAVLEVTFELKNKYKDDDTRYQEWTITMECDSVAVVNGTDYSGHYTQHFKLSSDSGNIFPCDRIGISVALNGSWAGDFGMISASSTGVR